MSVAPEENPSRSIEDLLLLLAKAYHWAGLYGADHRVLAERVRELHAALVSRLPREPEGQLLLGIAKGKVLYRNDFVGEKQELIQKMTECLYLLQVATLGFGPEITPDELILFFRYLHDSRTRETPEIPESFLRRQGIRGIRLSPYNYKELLSRTISEAAAPEEGKPDREETLWRILLTSNLDADEEGEKKVVEEVLEFPELIQGILRRGARRVDGGENRPGGGASTGSEQTVSSEVLLRVFRRLGMMIRRLPEERRKEVFASLEDGLPPAEPGTDGGEDPLSLLVTRSLTADYSDGEFLDVVATLVSAERKGGGRIRKIFEILAVERNVRESLLPQVTARAQESLKAKNYYALKTWETIEKLLLSRSEEAYLEEDYARFLETISAARAPFSGRLSATDSPAPALVASLAEDETRRRTILLLLELLMAEKEEPEFYDLLEEIRKVIPNLISRGEAGLLRTVLGGLTAVSREARPEWQSAVRDVILQTDFGHLIDLCLAGGGQDGASATALSLLAEFAAMAVHPLLDRLLREPDASRRRGLLRIAAQMGPPVVPDVAARLSHPKWYFVRNLCLILGEIGDRRAVRNLIQAADHPDPRVKREAIAAMGKMKAAEALAALGRILLDENLFSFGKDDPVRVAAATAIFHIGGSQALAFLHQGKDVRRRAVRDHCAELIQRHKGDA